MKIESLEIPGLLLIYPDVFKDERGYFFESYTKSKLEGFNFYENFVQDNISKSKYGTVRGLHYQVGEFAQGKLVQALKGKVLDVAVDVRFGSPSFGKYFSVELSDENNLQFWIPPGFAHGFSVLSEEAIFQYKCTQYYHKSSERAIIFNDKHLNIDWKVNEYNVSPKDMLAGSFLNIEKDFIYKQ